MSDRIRQVMAYLIAMGMVIAVASAPTVAQTTDDTADPVFEAAGVSVDKVDGLDATKYSTNRVKRAGKLVATNANGVLPSNIVKPQWRVIQNKPAALADGVDDIGPSYASRVIYDSVTSGDGALGWGQQRWITLEDMPRGVDILFTPIPASGGDAVGIERTRVWANSDGTLSHAILIQEGTADSSHFKVRALTFGDGIAPAQLKALLKAAKVTASSKRK